MKIVVVLLNIVLFLFTCMVIATDGMSNKAIYIAFALALLIVPILTGVVLLGAVRGAGMQRAAVIGNVVLLVATVLAFVDQYPHPQEPGFVEYMVVVVLTPILSLVALLRGNRSRRPQDVPAGSGAQA